jgi:hypothetical protein
MNLCWIFGSHNGDCEEYGLLGHNAKQFGESLTFRRNMPPTFSESKSKPSKKPAEAGDKLTIQTTWHYSPEDHILHESSSRPHTLFKIYFSIILLFISRSPRWAFRLNICMHFSCDNNKKNFALDRNENPDIHFIATSLTELSWLIGRFSVTFTKE